MFADINDSHHDAKPPDNGINQGQNNSSIPGETSGLADFQADGPKQKTQQIIILAVLIIIVAVALIGFIAAGVMDRKSVPLLIEIGSLYQSTGRTQDAIRIFDEAAAIGISRHELQARVGDLYRLARDYDKSITFLNRALASEPTNETYRFSLARSLASAGRCIEAIPQYLNLLHSKPENYTYSTGVIACYRSLQDYDKAHAEVDRYIALIPTDYLAYQLKGDLYRDQHQWHAAIEQYQKAIESNLEAYSAYINMGFSYNDLRDFAAARAEFLAASAINPSRPEPYYYAAETYIGQGNFDAAIPFYEQALEVDDAYFLALLGLGKTYAAKEECSLAIPYFRKVLILNLGNEDATQGLNNCPQTP